MKLKKVKTKTIGNYPTSKSSWSDGTLRKLIVGASVTLGLSLASCGGKPPSPRPRPSGTAPRPQEETKPRLMGKVQPARADSDSDGIDDSKDKCPNKAGTIKNSGCPDPKPQLPGSTPPPQPAPKPNPPPTKTTN
jgi:hypothetical protein